MTARHSHEHRPPHPSVIRRVADRRARERHAVDDPDLDEAALDTSVRWVRVTCPDCGVVRVRTDHVVVRNCVDDQTWTYRARCSECDTIFLGDTPEALALAALAAGVGVETWTRPLPSARRPGEPLRALDALQLHIALLDHDWFDTFSRVEPPLGER